MSFQPKTPSIYTQEEGTIHLGGIEALVRLSLDQVRTDRRAGLNTGMFISGYRGSPVGMLDENFLKQKKLLLENNIHFVDGLNEDLAATAVWGTQMLHTVGKQKLDGVTGLWYGKAPGVDRSGDALKHANYTGIGRNGGVLAIAGDDPSCKSSSLCSQSEPMLFHVGIPSLYPGNVQEILDLGLHGYNMSRLSGVWVGMKIVTNVADGHGTAHVSPDRLQFVTPQLEFNGKPFAPQMNLGMNVRAEALEMERTLYNERLKMVREYARVNKLNNVVFPNRDAWLGILTAGKTYHDLIQAFSEMGLDEESLRRYGIRILKMGMLFPMEPSIVREFAQGLEEIFVIEEKRPFLEMFAKNVLYGMANAPRIVGKTDEEDNELLPHYGEFESDVIAKALLARLSRKARLESAESWIERLAQIGQRTKLPTAARTAWFCSGCPHSSSTHAPEGSIVSAGIGCHTMAMWMNRNVVMGTHMGAEGAQWIGMAPFTETEHIFQNMGDGTYFHSGNLAVKYCASTDVNITFKLLYNAHTSMTGGQDVQGSHPVANVVADLLANGVKKVIVTTNEPERYQGVTLSGGTEVWHRDRLMEAQKVLAAIQGTTVLIHDQECAAELRRARSRGKAEEPVQQVVINERVCEGCGDCGEKSNCMSVEPVPTEFGRKTRIHAPSCNKDFSCVKGFCPSFVTVTPARSAAPQPKKKKGRLPALGRDLPEPTRLFDGDFGIHIMGIGGTGTVSVAAMLARAARIDGKYAIGLDQTGLAQKGGSVISDIKITSRPNHGANKITDACADLYLGFDILNATDPKNLDKCHPERTIAIVSTAQAPTGFMVSNKNVQFPAMKGLVQGINRVTRKEHNVFMDAQQLAEGLFNDNMATNTFMVGVAYQAGALPIAAFAIEDAIRASGVGVDMSLLAFQWGRMAALDRDYVQSCVAGLSNPAVMPANESRHPMVEKMTAPLGLKGEMQEAFRLRVHDLIAYQSVGYAQQFVNAVQKAWQKELAVMEGKSMELTLAVIRNLHKLMAYKDEYEVARLHCAPAFLESLRLRFGDDCKVQYHLAPPLLARRDPQTGQLIKKTYGSWMLGAFRFLACFRGLRGTVWDVFGKTQERRLERQMVRDYISLVDDLCAKLSTVNLPVFLELMNLPEQIRGYGHVKEAAIKAAQLREADLHGQLGQPQICTEAMIARGRSHEPVQS